MPSRSIEVCVEQLEYHGCTPYENDVFFVVFGIVILFIAVVWRGKTNRVLHPRKRIRHPPFLYSACMRTQTHYKCIIINGIAY